MKAWGARGQQQEPPQPFGGRVPTESFQSRVGTYLDILHGGVNYHNKTTDVLFSQFHIERLPLVSPHYPYILTWEELWSQQGDGVGPSGTRDDGDDY